MLPESVTPNIHHIQPPTRCKCDYPFWLQTYIDDMFSIRSTYNVHCTIAEVHNDADLFKLVWNWQGHARMRITLWKMAHVK